MLRLVTNSGHEAQDFSASSIQYSLLIPADNVQSSACVVVLKSVNASLRSVVPTREAGGAHQHAGLSARAAGSKLLRDQEPREGDRWL